MTERIEISCNQCQKRMAVPRTAMGKKIRCPGCSSVVAVPDQPATPSSVETAKQASDTRRKVQKTRQRKSTSETPAPKRTAKRTTNAGRPKRSKVSPEQTRPRDDAMWSDGTEVDEDPYSAPNGGLPPKRSKRSKSRSSTPARKGSGNEAPRAERRQGMSFGARMTQGGGIKGLLMMIGAAIWFFAGLAGGRIFFYPPVMFLFGLFMSLKAVFGSGD